MKKVAAYTGTRNLYHLMVPAVKSLLCNSDVDEVWLFIEDDELPEWCYMPFVKVRNASKQAYFPANGPNMRSRFTYMAMMRAAFAKEFPEYDRILSLDVDTIVDRDISDLWELPIDDYYMAASIEPGRSEMEGHFYANIGVCLYNLEKLRDGKCDEAIRELNTNDYRFVEQDVFNDICRGAIYDMPSEYNATPFTKKCDDPKIYHFAGMSNWEHKIPYRHYRGMSWEEVLEHREKTYGG